MTCQDDTRIPAIQAQPPDGHVFVRTTESTGCAEALPPVIPDQPPPADPGMIPLTVPEIRRLLAVGLLRPHPPGHAGPDELAFCWRRECSAGFILVW